MAKIFSEKQYSCKNIWKSCVSNKEIFFLYVLAKKFTFEKYFVKTLTKYFNHNIFSKNIFTETL